MVEVSNSEDDFEVFNQPQSLEALVGDFSHLLPTKVSHTQEALIVLDVMVLQRKTRSSLLDLLESHAGGNMPKKAIQTKPPTPPNTQAPQHDPVDKKRKRDQKGKEVMEEGKGLPSKEVEPQKGAKAAKTAHTRSSSEGSMVERGYDHQVKVPAWNPPLVLDGAHLPINASIRGFQYGKAGYVTNAVEQALLLPRDMADLRSMKKHEVLLSLKRDLALVSLLVIFLLLKVSIAFSNHYTFSLKDCSSYAQGQRVGEQLPQVDEG